MWWIAVYNVAVLQRSLLIPFFRSLSSIPLTTQGMHQHGYTMLVLSKHRLGSVEMNAWEFHSLPVDVLVNHNGHIRLCHCGLTLHCSWVHRWSRRLWSGSTLILPFPRHQSHSSQHLYFLINASLVWCWWTTTGTTELIGCSLLRYIISCRRWMDVVVEGG